MNRLRILAILFFLSLTFFSCSPRAEYEKKLAREMASGERHDSLFMGLYLGMPEKDFYLHCWALNKQGLIKQGASNTTVEYQIKNGLKYPAVMDFYPKFHEGRISELPVRIKYKGWVPWNKKLSSESLQKDVLHWYEKSYGRGFLKVTHPERGKAFVKIDGNRRITIFRGDELYVWAVFTDLLVQQGWNSFSNDSTAVGKN